ncbi:hybrid sensor histidine kinase/response regulator [Poseidonibacter ostreae]|uniref:histidine kinase n=1 Tax=Poseidonibacter ostreae TaxID=2654171 RepID=A0A6L4WNT3_9BACT|nr:hybrid sensor histidine kinase/response regulator [Poseidonibacter ostreae]KAB7884228.1 response regulator [Poseidonibacter ostreae]KAB7885031.1 response regulator [Poseidonibacter ostreae]KAB7889825.1 response regulator [Poseidonibacter ostreae]
MENKFSILILDDVQENIYSLELLINDAFDLNVFTADNANSAVECLMNNDIDLILSDVQMPEVDGFEFAKYLKSVEKTKDIPIIFITGIYDKDAYQKKGYELGAIEYISKPIDDTLLISKLKVYIQLFNENKKTKKSLTQANAIITHNTKMASLGEMIGLISHQLKQPLNILSLYCDDIKFSYNFNELNDQQIKEFSENTKKQIHYMSDTIDDFLGFFNPDKSKEEFAILDAIEYSFSLIESLVNNNNVVITKNIDDNFKLFGVKMEMSQVIVNILTNSIQAFNERNIEKRDITIECYSKDSKHYLVIGDNAGGIKESNLEKLFDPYFTTKSEGTGVGLYMVKLVVMNSFAGKLSLENSVDGVKFILEFDDL